MTEQFKSFLLSYVPANPHFTSWSEVEKILEFVFAEIGGRENCTVNSIREIRNSVVSFYHPLIEPDTDEAYQKLTSLQSVTAAIDHLIFTISGEV